MRQAAKLIVLWAALLTVCGCSTPQAFEDVSSSPAFRAYVGASYRLEVAMHLSGVNAPPGYRDTVDYYVVNPTSPGWKGPELVTRDTLPAGTVVVVKSVRRCTNCILDEVVDAQVRIVGVTTTFTRPIHIQVKHLAPGLAKKLHDP